MDEAFDREADLIRRRAIFPFPGSRNFGFQFGTSHFQYFRRAIEDLSTQVGTLFGPAREGRARSHDRVAKILARGARVIGDDLPAGLRRRDPAALAPDEFSPDEKFVCFLNLESIYFSGHGRSIA